MSLGPGDFREIGNVSLGPIYEYSRGNLPFLIMPLTVAQIGE